MAHRSQMNLKGGDTRLPAAQASRRPVRALCFSAPVEASGQASSWDCAPSVSTFCVVGSRLLRLSSTSRGTCTSGRPRPVQADGQCRFQGALWMRSMSTFEAILPELMISIPLSDRRTTAADELAPTSLVPSRQGDGPGRTPGPRPPTHRGCSLGSRRARRPKRFRPGLDSPPSVSPSTVMAT